MADFDYILDTPITATWLKDKFLEGSPRKSKVQLKSWSAEMTGENKGFVSFIIRVVFHWSEQDKTLPKSVVIKCPTGQKIKKVTKELMPEMEEMFEEFDTFVPLVHKTECTFYSMWGKETIPLKTPKCYFCQEIAEGQPGILVFEDLCDVLAQQAIGRGLTVTQLTQVAENLASLHAWSLTHEGWQKKFKIMPREPFEKFPENNKIMYEKLKSEMCPQHFDAKMIDEVIKHTSTVDDIFYAFELHQEMKMPPVLVHGDLWAGNMMFKKKVGKDGKAMASDELLTIFDWQTCFPGCASLDFLRMACTSMRVDTRRDKLPSIMQHYYKTLKEKLGKEPPFTYDILMKSYSRGLKAAFLMGFGVLIMFVGKNPDFYGGPQYDEEMMYRAKCLLEDTVANLQSEW